MYVEYITCKAQYILVFPYSLSMIFFSFVRVSNANSTAFFFIPVSFSRFFCISTICPWVFSSVFCSDKAFIFLVFPCSLPCPVVGCDLPILYGRFLSTKYLNIAAIFVYQFFFVCCHLKLWRCIYIPAAFTPTSPTFTTFSGFSTLFAFFAILL